MLKHLRFVVLSAVVIGLALPSSLVLGQSVPVADEFSALHFRSIGPASMSGRVTDLAVYEPNPAIYYVATAHGGVWKTSSAGARSRRCRAGLRRTSGSGRNKPCRPAVPARR